LIVPEFEFMSLSALRAYNGNRLKEPIMELLDREKTMFTRSAITPPKVNRFGWNLEHCEYIVWGWPWQILVVIRAVMTVWESCGIFLVK